MIFHTVWWVLLFWVPFLWVRGILSDLSCGSRSKWSDFPRDHTPPFWSSPCSFFERVVSFFFVPLVQPCHPVESGVLVPCLGLRLSFSYMICILQILWRPILCTTSLVPEIPTCCWLLDTNNWGWEWYPIRFGLPLSSVHPFVIVIGVSLHEIVGSCSSIPEPLFWTEFLSRTGPSHPVSPVLFPSPVGSWSTSLMTSTKFMPTWYRLTEVVMTRDFRLVGVGLGDGDGVSPTCITWFMRFRLKGKSTTWVTTTGTSFSFR